jgi:hypothetical protein
MESRNRGSCSPFPFIEDECTMVEVHDGRNR